MRSFRPTTRISTYQELLADGDALLESRLPPQQGGLDGGVDCAVELLRREGVEDGAGLAVDGADGRLDGHDFVL